MSINNSPSFDALMACADITSFSGEEALRRIGDLIDLSHDLNRDDGTGRALEWCNTLERMGNLPENELILLWYYRSNAWANRYNHKRAGKIEAWAINQSEIEHAILDLRRAVNHVKFDKIHSLRQCQILTNLGNSLSEIGRFVDAIEYWERVLAINPRFGMALGNRGYCLFQYAKALYNNNHKIIFLQFAHQSLSAALSEESYYESPNYEKQKTFFKKRKEEIDAILKTKTISINKQRRKMGKSEFLYRNWCLKHRLFLSPLNDLGVHEIASKDVLLLPAFVTKIDNEQLGGVPFFVKFFNQIKQEFVSARWLLYDGSHASKKHFSDREVLLINTLNYPIYSLASEKTKAAYRIAYSLFDKIAFFLNSYFDLAPDSTPIYFRSVWYQNHKAKDGVFPKLENIGNRPLRGLHWLSKDLFQEGFRNVTEPDAQNLNKIRNHLEHKYFQIHDMLPSPPANEESYSIQHTDFMTKALKLLKLSRAALIYLTLAMHQEEHRRTTEKDVNTMIAPMNLSLWRDEWK